MLSNMQHTVSDWQRNLQEAPNVHYGVWMWLRSRHSVISQTWPIKYDCTVWPGLLHKDCGATVTHYVVIHTLRKIATDSWGNSFHTEIWIHHQVLALMNKMRKYNSHDIF